MDRLSYILELLPAEVREAIAEPMLDLVKDGTGDADRAWLGKVLQPYRDVDSVSQDIITIDDDFIEVDADTELNSLGPRGASISSGHAPLDCHGAFDRRDYTRKFDQDAVAHRLNDAPVVFSDFS